MKKLDIIELINKAMISKEMCRILFKYNYHYSYHFPLKTSEKLFLSANEDDFIRAVLTDLKKDLSGNTGYIKR